jgi:hypothetical protein
MAYKGGKEGIRLRGKIQDLAIRYKNYIGFGGIRGDRIERRGNNKVKERNRGV